MSSLLISRKFWLTVFTVVGLLVALLTKQINGTTFAPTATAAVMLLVAAIAHEDTAKKGAEATVAGVKAMTDSLAASTKSALDATPDAPKDVVQ